MFLIYFHIISHKFVPASLRKPCVILVSEKIVFSPMVFDGNPTHFIPVIFEKSKFVNSSYVKLFFECSTLHSVQHVSTCKWYNNRNSVCIFLRAVSHCHHNYIFVYHNLLETIFTLLNVTKLRILLIKKGSHK